MTDAVLRFRLVHPRDLDRPVPRGARGQVILSGHGLLLEVPKGPGFDLGRFLYGVVDTYEPEEIRWLDSSRGEEFTDFAGRTWVAVSDDTTRIARTIWRHPGAASNQVPAPSPVS